MKPKETIALMGAHTLGRMNPNVSGFKYFWTRGESNYFNNRYYKNLVQSHGFAIGCDEDDHHGNR